MIQLFYRGKNPIGHSTTTVVYICFETGCDVIELRETRREQQGLITHMGYVVMLSGARAQTKDEKEVHGVGFAIRQAIRDRLEDGDRVSSASVQGR